MIFLYYESETVAKALWQKNACIEFVEMQRPIKIKRRSKLLVVRI